MLRVFLVGIVFGSFLDCLAFRLSFHLPLRGRSVCENCGHVLSFLDLIPIFSFLFLKGKCRYCGKKIRISLFLGECLFGILFVIFFYYWHDRLFFLLILFFLSLCDLYAMIVPDLGLIVFSAPLFFFPETRLLRGFLVFATFFILKKGMDLAYGKECFGMGDVYLIGEMGWYLNLRELCFVLIVSCLLSLLFIKKGKELPFVPFLSIGFLLLLISKGLSSSLI